MTPSETNARRLERARTAFFGTRSRFGSLLRRVGAVRVSPRYRGARWISAAILVLLAFLLVSGVLLALYYNPGPQEAYASTRLLVTEVGTGWLVRSMHYWAGELLLVAVLIHLALTFFHRAYTRPREYVWVAGVFLLVLTLAFRFTGRLLPWDEFGYEAGQQSLAMIASVPVLGDLAATWLRGGGEFGVATLSRFFATHVMILPWLTVLVAGIHLYLVKSHGLKDEGDDK